MTLSMVLAEIFFCIIGLIFILVGIKALQDQQFSDRVPTAVFWFILAFTFIGGPYFPNWVTGLCILAITVISALGKVSPSKSDIPEPEDTRRAADRTGNRIFIPPLSLALVALLVATFFSTQIGANNAIGFAALAALILVYWITKAPLKSAVTDGTRLMDNIGPVGILPQLLAALGTLFTAAGVGEVIASAVSSLIPEGNLLAATAVYCIGMALFTIIMGNGFAAFSVITVGIGMPFLIMQGANPAVVGALGLTAGYCGTLVTPMAANFNIMPAALLETKNKYIVIRCQAPVAAVMLIIHIFLMYFLAF
ncbi:MAG: DUF979 domain-containing protein [Lachnospiraceae bacterium]